MKDDIAVAKPVRDRGWPHDRRTAPDGRERRDALWRRDRDQGRLVRHPQGRGPRDHRPERRRQDVDAQRHQRLLSSAGRRHHLQGREAQRHAAPCGGNSGDCPHLPERRPVQRHDDHRQHHDRSHAEDAPRNPCSSASLSARPRRRDPPSRGRRAGDRFPRDRAHPQDAGRQVALWPAEARRTRPRAGDGAGTAAARRADGRHEPGREAGHEPLHSDRQRDVRHDDRADRA